MADEKTSTGLTEESRQNTGTEKQSGQDIISRGETMAPAAMTIPAANVVEVVTVPAGAELPIAFSLDDVEMMVVGGDLQLGFENGSTLVLQGFATEAATDNPPALLMADGTLLPGDAVIFSSADAELAPAAGPALGSGGVGSYRSDMGEVITGLDRLGTQDPGTLAATEGTVLDDQSLPLDENAPPDALDDVITTPEDTAVIIPVLDNDTDLDGDTLIIESATQGGSGAVVINDDGTITYVPGENFNGQDSFTYTIIDGQGGSDTATVTVNVTPDNDPPDALDDAVTTPEDTAVIIPVLENDTDIDGDPLMVESVTDGEHGSVAINDDGTVTYTPGADFNGQDSFTYTINDGQGGTDTATVIVDVTPDNDPPDALDDAVTTPEDTAVIIPVLENDTDIDGDPLTVESVTDGAHGSVVINDDGTVTYTPGADFNGQDSFIYTINDGQGGTDTATVIVDVTPVNDPPDAVDDAATTSEDASVIIPVLTNDSDPDGDPLDIVNFTDPQLGSVVENADGTMSYDPEGQFEGLDEGETAEQSFTYTISDGQGGSDTATVDVTIEGVNDAPIAIDDGQAVNTAVLIGSTNTTPTGFYLVSLSNPEDPNVYSNLFEVNVKFDELSYDASGQLWGAENANRQFYTIDIQTGELTLQFTLPDTVGNDIDGFTFGSIGGEEKLYALGGSTLFVIDPITTEIIDSHDLSDSSNDLADLVLLNSKLYTVSSNGSFFEINLDGAGNIALDNNDEPIIDLLTGSNFNSVYGLVAGSDGLLYVVTSTGNSGEASALMIDSDADSYSVESTWDLDATGISGNFLGLAGQVNPVTEVSGNVLINDYDPDNLDGIISDTLTVIAVDGNPLDDPNDPSDPVDEIELSGTFGDLTMYADGSYTYSLTDELTPGLEIFTYTISDGDAEASAELTFFVNNYATASLSEQLEGLQTMMDLDGPMVYSFSANGGEGDLIIEGFDIDNDVIRLTDVLDFDGDGGLDAGDLGVSVMAQGTDLLVTISGAEGLDTTITLADVGQYQGVDSLESLAQAGFQVEYTG